MEMKFIKIQEIHKKAEKKKTIFKRQNTKHKITMADLSPIY